MVACIYFAIIAPEGQSLINTHIYQGYGLGLRLLNEHLIFSLLQVKLGFYPGAEAYTGNWYSLFEPGGSYYQFNSFQPGKPGVAGFEF